MVRHVGMLSGFMIAHGILLLLVGVLILGGAIFLRVSSNSFFGADAEAQSEDFDSAGQQVAGEIDVEADFEQSEAGAPSDDELAEAALEDDAGPGNTTPIDPLFSRRMGIFIAIFYLIIGSLTAGTGVLQIVAGIRNRQFKNRILGVMAVSIGAAAIMLVYCAPTAIALLIYGLIVLLNPSVEEAFIMRDEGLSREDILSRY